MTKNHLVQTCRELSVYRESLKTQGTPNDVDVMRMVAIARTHMETAELFLTKAANSIPDE